MIDSLTINGNAVELRKKMGVDAYSPLDIFALVSNEKDLTIIFYPMTQNISGMCIREKNNRVIAVNSTSSYGRQRFTLAHELCHLYFHKTLKKVVCGKNFNSTKDPLEKEADSFASYFLAPHEALRHFVNENFKKKSLDISELVQIEQYFGLSREAMLYRLKLDGYLITAKTEEVKREVRKSALRLGYDDKLYVPTPEKKQHEVFGKYIQLAEELYEKEKISNGKYEELLMDAFRADLVYGMENEDCFD
jgi:Zn-dependent peptidase ImmA (M78 family)